MRAHVNGLLLLLRAPVAVVKGLTTTLQRPSWLPSNRRLHSDAPVAAVAASVAPEEPRPPLQDLIGRRHDYLRISLTERCNLRCQYCMPVEGVPLTPRARLLAAAEVARVARVLAATGVRKVRLTGGEPTLRKDLPDIIHELCSIEGIESVSMTSNGLVLTRQLPALQRAGLAHINISLDTLRPDRYERMARRPGLSRVLAGIDLALQLGYKPVKVNTVLMRGFNDDEICDFVEFTRDRAVEVRFIEFMPFAGNAWDDGKLVPQREALRAVALAHPDIAPCLPRPNDTARVWQVPGYAGSVGFISSMTNHFCATCNRLRLTADGNLKVCLFGAAEVSLRDAMRAGASDAALEEMVRAALRNKKPQHAAAAAATRMHSGNNPASLRIPTQGAIPSPRHVFSIAPALFRLGGVSSARAYSTREGDEESPTLTHLDGEGHARMVDVSDKPVTSRAAAAECSLRVNARLLRALRDRALPKGDALAVARVAGVLAAKRAADLIPLCHPVPLEHVRVSIELPHGECAAGGAVLVRCEVRASARTGAEMEALAGAAVAALALYDMGKALDRRMRVTDLRVTRKQGGRSGDWPPRAEGVTVRAHDTSPIKTEEAYVPANVMHF